MSTAPVPPRLPRLIDPAMPLPLRIYVDELVRAIEAELGALRASAGAPYAISGGTGARTLNVSTATAGQVAGVVATLISDLKEKGQVSA